MHNDIEFHTQSYLNIIEKDPHHRYRSWEHCYNFFKHQEQVQDGLNISNEACLNLGFYLASKGMYSGLNGLLWKDYRVYSSIIEILIDAKYANLWGVGINRLVHNELLVESIMEVKNKLYDEISTITFQKSGNEHPEKIRSTDTMVNKILLGTMGCVPSYDTKFKEGCKKADIDSFSSLDYDSFSLLIDFYLKNKAAIQRASFHISNKRNMEYPDMKILDINFNQLANFKEEQVLEYS